MSTKRKRAVFFAGISAAVYGGIRYLLPLVLPFFISYGLARMAWHPAAWMKKKTGLPEGIGAGICLAVYAAAFIGLLWWLGGLAGKQAAELAKQLPVYLEQAGSGILWFFKAVCGWMGIGNDAAETAAQGFTSDIGALLGEAAAQKAAGGLLPFMGKAGSLFAAAATAFVSAVFFIDERGRIRQWMQTSIFRREIRILSRRLGSLARAFFKTQGLIFLLVTCVCTAGLCLLGNPYFLLAGTAIGLLDVLPVFGTGTVLIPWAFLCAFLGKWGQAAGLTVIYLITYYLREFLEARMMGKELGISSLEMMIAMYAGLKLFGIGGLFLGPVGWILIKEIDKTLYFG